MAHLPLVSVITPVFNGDKYLAECIESVLNQRYENWDYTIVNNCSTDSTLEVAARYANSDSRIKIVTNARHVGLIANHNIAFSLISSESKYCKVISADDWISADCISKMVELAEAHPTVGIVGVYQQFNERVVWNDLPLDTAVLSGREACRLSLLRDDIMIFGPPTSVLYRSDLIRNHVPFFPHSLPHADISTFYQCLQYCDLGLVHHVLSFGRVHEHQESCIVTDLGASFSAYLDDILRYGKIYLSEKECEQRVQHALQQYYRYLGGCVFKLKKTEFWRYNKRRLKELGYPLRWPRVIIEAVKEFREEMQNPHAAFQKLSIAMKRRGRHFP
jgi:glycosyltransferase involved in cell wall biosynthesis